MTNPRSLIRALDKHWDIIEQLVLAGKNQSNWDSETLLTLLKRQYVQESQEHHFERLQQLLNAEVLLPLPRSSEFELNPVVQDFVSQLLNEYDLGSPDIIKAHIGEIKIALADLQAAMQNQDMAALQRGVGRIHQQLLEVDKRIQGDAHAIADIAERAKTADTQIPLARRYQEVLNTYERYILPMTELMDTGAGGMFYPLLEQTEKLIETLAEQLAVQGALVSHQRSLKLLGFRIKDLRRTGREILKKCTDTLMPLREEYRRHNQLSVAVARLLGEVRKRGLRRTFSHADLPLWRKEPSLRITIDRSILMFMAQARGYMPKPVEFPEVDEQNPAEQQEWVDEKAIEQHLLNSLPVEDLFVWLLENYRQYQDSTLLKLYHRLCRLPEIEATHQDTLSRHSLTHYAIKLYSHRLTLHEH